MFRYIIIIIYEVPTNRRARAADWWVVESSARVVVDIPFFSLYEKVSQQNLTIFSGGKINIVHKISSISKVVFKNDKSHNTSRQTGELAKSRRRVNLQVLSQHSKWVITAVNP